VFGGVLVEVGRDPGGRVPEPLSHDMAGYRSLARHAGVDLGTVLRHAENGTLRSLLPLEARSRTRDTRSSRPGTLDPKQALLVL
jgi:hypothetical protein